MHIQTVYETILHKNVKAT